MINFEITNKKFKEKRKLTRKYFKRFQYTNSKIVINHYKRNIHSIFTDYFLFSLWIEILNQKELFKQMNKKKIKKILKEIKNEKKK